MLLSWTLILALAPAQAQEAEFEEFAEPVEEVAAPETDLAAELGGNFTSGNARFATMTGGVNAGRKWSQNQLSGHFGLAYTRGVVDDGDGFLTPAQRQEPWSSWEWSSQRLTSEARYDRFLGEKNSLYVLAGADSDVLAGFRLRAHEQLGYSRQLVGTDQIQLLAELGLDVAQEEYNPDSASQIEGLDYVFPSARVMVGGEFVVNENVKFTEEIEAFENLRTVAGPLRENDLRVYNRAALSVRLSEKFSLKLSHNLTFDNVPVLWSDNDTPDVWEDDERYAKLDQTSTVTFVASIF